MKYEDIKWVRQSEILWRAEGPGGYEITWSIGNNGIAILYGYPTATGGYSGIKTVEGGKQAVNNALEQIDKRRNDILSKADKEWLIQESKETLE